MLSSFYLQAQPYLTQSEAHNPTNTEYTVLPNEEAPKLSLLFLAVTSPHWRWKQQAFCLPGASRWPQGNIYCLALHQRLLRGWSFLKWDMPASSTSPKLLAKWGKHQWFHTRNGDYRSIAVTQSWEASQLLSSPTLLPVPPCLTVPDNFMVHHPLHLWMAQRQWRRVRCKSLISLYAQSCWESWSETPVGRVSRSCWHCKQFTFPLSRNQRPSEVARTCWSFFCCCCWLLFACLFKARSHYAALTVLKLAI